jgi:very-short-patch-repair endonuclease
MANQNFHCPNHRGSIYQYARELRQNQTEAEEKLWESLRGRKLNGKKFRRQHPISGYILDFYCHEFKLGVELDEHDFNTDQTKEREDDAKSKFMNRLDITMLKFWNHEVMEEHEKVLDKIAAYLE